MKRCIPSIFVVMLFAVGVAAGVARAAENGPPVRSRMGAASAAGDCCWNADDYCRKPLPIAPCSSWSCNPECYVRKPLPAAPCLSSCATCDDYVRKCYPQPPWQCATPGLPRKIYSSVSRQPPQGAQNPGIWLW